MIQSTARPARALAVAPHGWLLDDAPASPADSARADAAVTRQMAGLPADWRLPHGMLVVDVDDARRVIRVTPAPAPAPDYDGPTWEGVPCRAYSDAWGTIIMLPDGHADLGYAPGSQFYGETD